MITLVLGGTRSGKSEVAEDLAASVGEPVTYVATGAANDPEMAARIAVHRARRPATWATVEVAPGGDLAGALAILGGVTVVDSLGGWVAGCEDFRADTGALCRALEHRDGNSIVVSEEVGLGVHSSTETGRRFADALGAVNRAIADMADEVLLVVAGRILPLVPLDASGRARPRAGSRFDGP